MGFLQRAFEALPAAAANPLALIAFLAAVGAVGLVCLPAPAIRAGHEAGRGRLEAAG